MTSSRWAAMRFSASPICAASLSCRACSRAAAAALSASPRSRISLRASSRVSASRFSYAATRLRVSSLAFSAASRSPWILAWRLSSVSEIAGTASLDITR